MNAFAMLLFTAAVAHGIARALRLPVLPVWIGAGMLLNVSGILPAGFGLDGGGDAEVTGGVLRFLGFGLVFLVFSSGTELNPRRFARRGKAVAWVGVVQFLVSAGVGYVSARWMGFGGVESLYIGFGVAASSTLVVLRQLRERQAWFEPFGRVLTGVLLLQDVMLIGVIVVLSRLEAGISGISMGVGETAGLFAVAWLAQRRGIPWLIGRMKPDEESLLLWLVAVLFGFVGVADWLGLPAVVGAFAAGFVFSAFPLNGLVRGQLRTLAEFFQALFFVTLGVLVGVPEASHWWMALQFSAVVVIITPPLVALVAEWRGLNTRASIESGLLLAQTSEFSLLLGAAGLGLGHLSVMGFEVLALTTVITMMLTPLLGREAVAHFLLKLHPFRARTRFDEPPAGHVLVLGFGSAGMWTVKPLRAQGEEVLVVDDDAVVCRELTRLGVPVMRGDASEQAVLDRAGAGKAKLVIASMRRVTDALKVLDALRGVPVVVRVFEVSEAEAVRERGGIPVMNSKAGADQFMEWFGNKFPR